MSTVLAGLACTVPTRAQLPEVRTAPPATLLVEEDERNDRDFVRLRVGFDATGGAFVRGPQVGLGGVRARLGIELGGWLSVYYMATGLVGTFTPRGTESWTAGLIYNSAILEVRLHDLVEIAAGPSIDFGWGCAEPGQRGLWCTDHGPFFGLDGRVAVVVARTQARGRAGVTLSADVHPTWYPTDVGVTVLGSIGLELY